DGGQQAGYNLVGTEYHASLWSGTATSWIDLNPAGSTESMANAAGGGQQAGYAILGGVHHAGLWSGTAASWVDLSPFLPAGFTDSYATGISNDGVNQYVSGYGFNSLAGRNEAIVWTQSIPAPGAAALLGLGGILVARRRR
ncbi:MAG TPA: hypothetical protein VHC70_09690, partial [Phycisphaerales bacterium]|nr:hypothetical protein [Phycisphaerales bacterium]